MIAVWAERAWTVRMGKLPVGAFLVVAALTARFIILLSVSEPPQWTWPVHRAQLIQRLSGLNRRQLVIVRYPAPDWRIEEEWVYNGADIDSQRVIFAHDLGPDQNGPLLSRYSDRAVSLLTFDSASGRERTEPYVK
jgi:hypothetical protein